MTTVTQNGHLPPPLDTETRQAIFKRDGGRCCITGKTGTFHDPLLTVPILPVPSGWTTDRVGINDMLGAFFGQPYLDWWLSYAREPEWMPRERSHWLVRRSAARAFERGLIRLDRLQASMVEFSLRDVLPGLEKPIEADGLYPLLGDHSRSGIMKLDPRFVGTHARLSTSIRYLEISKTFSSSGIGPRRSSTRACLTAPNSRPGLRKPSSILSPVTSALLKAWLLIPNRIRMAAYELLQKVGKFLYGPSASIAVQRLPFGLYLKTGWDQCRNEFNALQIVHRHTYVPAPKALDLVSRPRDSDDPFAFNDFYLLVTRTPGVLLSLCHHLLSDEDLDAVAGQLEDYITQLREIPKSVNPAMAICNTLGEACQDNRIRGSTPVGPFKDEEAFSQILRYSNDPARRGHRIVFTHGDLNPRNILVDQVPQPDERKRWEVTGIVDWETAGYYPEYWEYTKAMLEGFRWERRYNNWVKGVFEKLGDYSREMDVEKRSWESGDAV
ncbi:hypothetical protein ACRALDRAFT_1094268 [Sodiomyces alcalophilus JCM 7366]|uniref:uncharacterized protein n=1 Tax=Sodiomyces alcalophilus JCM 7366 TaxID=591952 RepID=UPI0039B60FC4